MGFPPRDLSGSDLLAARPDVGEHGIDAALVDQAHAGRRQAQLHEAVLRGRPRSGARAGSAGNGAALRLFACDTLLPVIGPLPVTWQTLDIRTAAPFWFRWFGRGRAGKMIAETRRIEGADRHVVVFVPPASGQGSTSAVEGRLRGSRSRGRDPSVRRKAPINFSVEKINRYNPTLWRRFSARVRWALSDQMRKLEAGWRTGNRWPQFLEWLEIRKIRGLVRAAVSSSASPSSRSWARTVSGRAPSLQSAACAYRAPKGGTNTTLYPAEFFPETAWDALKGREDHVRRPARHASRGGLDAQADVTLARWPPTVPERTGRLHRSESPAAGGHPGRLRPASPSKGTPRSPRRRFTPDQVDPSSRASWDETTTMPGWRSAASMPSARFPVLSKEGTHLLRFSTRARARPPSQSS